MTRVRRRLQVCLVTIIVILSSRGTGRDMHGIVGVIEDGWGCDENGCDRNVVARKTGSLEDALPRAVGEIIRYIDEVHDVGARVDLRERVVPGVRSLESGAEQCICSLQLERRMSCKIETKQ